MLIPTWFTEALGSRLILLHNNMVPTAPVPTARLHAHAGRCLQFDCVGPAGWPELPSLIGVITPAGLIEAVSPGGVADLRVVLDASQPLSLFMGAAQGIRPPIDVSGDAALASDISWLFDHLRWDLEDDLALWLGPVKAGELVRVGGFFMRRAREAATHLSAFSSRSEAGLGSPS